MLYVATIPQVYTAHHHPVTRKHVFQEMELFWFNYTNLLLVRNLRNRDPVLPATLDISTRDQFDLEFVLLGPLRRTKSPQGQITISNALKKLPSSSTITGAHCHDVRRNRCPIYAFFMIVMICTEVPVSLRNQKIITRILQQRKARRRYNSIY